MKCKVQHNFIDNVVSGAYFVPPSLSQLSGFANLTANTQWGGSCILVFVLLRIRLEIHLGLGIALLGLRLGIGLGFGIVSLRLR